jgi:predicted CXXCH cytochrome family protein
MRYYFKLFFSVALFLLISACATTGLYYLGFHGPYIKLSPDVHEDVIEDHECLECHRPDKDPDGPLTTHPGFTGCIKCHNDEIISAE